MTSDWLSVLPEKGECFEKYKSENPLHQVTWWEKFIYSLLERFQNPNST
jgi:hypothetical protein